MIFTLFDFLGVLGAIAGAMLGGYVGGSFGVPGIIGGVIIGLFIGRFIGNIPFILVIKQLQRKFADDSISELRKKLNDPACMIPNIILLELLSRGEDVTKDLPVVIGLLQSDETSKQGFGWAALTSAYPNLVKEIPDYQIGIPTSERQVALAPLKKFVESRR